MSDTNAEVSLISPSEWELMRVVWTEGPSKAKTLVENMSKKRQWSESTTKTLLRRLVSKGILTTKSVEGQRGFLYTPTVAEKEAMRDQAVQLFNSMCAMKRGSVLIELIERMQMTKGDLDNLTKVIENKRETAPETIDCDCLPGECDEHEGVAH